jgi:hypothetical protein
MFRQPLGVRCAWCRESLTHGTEPESHGICDECSRREFAVMLARRSVAAFRRAWRAARPAPEYRGLDPLDPRD